MKIDWRRTRKTGPSEDVRGEGVALGNGAKTPTAPNDGLAQQAATAEKKWLRGLNADARKSLFGKRS